VSQSSKLLYLDRHLLIRLFILLVSFLSMSVSISKQLKNTVTQNISEDLYIRLKHNRCESVARKVLYSHSEKTTVADRKTMELFFLLSIVTLLCLVLIGIVIVAAIEVHFCFHYFIQTQNF
jgi:hypothetical protein